MVAGARGPCHRNPGSFLSPLAKQPSLRVQRFFQLFRVDGVILGVGIITCGAPMWSLYEYIYDTPLTHFSNYLGPL